MFLDYLKKKERVIRRRKLGIISMDKDISNIIYKWLIYSSGKYFYVSYLEKFINILKELGIEGDLIFTDLEKNKFKVLLNEEFYEIILDFEFGVKFDSEIIVVEDNVKKIYSYRSFNNICKLERTVTKLGDCSLEAFYCEHHTTYDIYNSKFQVYIHLNEPLTDYNYPKTLIADKRHLIEYRLKNISKKPKVKDILLIISSVYDEKVINSSDRICITISKVISEKDNSYSKAIPLRKLTIDKGELISTFEKGKFGNISINLFEDNLEFSSKCVKLIMDSSGDEKYFEVKKMFKKKCSGLEIDKVKFAAKEIIYETLDKYRDLVAKMG